MSRTFGQPAHHFDETDTTMREAAELARGGCPEGTIVTANRQTAGRGRLGRSWLSEPGSGLYISLVLRPDIPAGAAPILTLVVGLGVAEAVARFSGVPCDIRWPNDILIGEKKCAGILVEMEAAGDRVAHVIAGVGLNLNYREFGPGLDDLATSLFLETKRRFESNEVLQPMLDSIRDHYEIYLDSGAPAILDAFTRASSYVDGRRVVIVGNDHDPATHRRGTTCGLDANGMLLLKDAGGLVAPVLAGSVRPDNPED